MCSARADSLRRPAEKATGLVLVDGRESVAEKQSVGSVDSAAGLAPFRPRLSLDLLLRA